MPSEVPRTKKPARAWPTELTISIVIALVLLVVWLVLGGIRMRAGHGR